jgi:hypothetical protein
MRRTLRAVRDIKWGEVTMVFIAVAAIAMEIVRKFSPAPNGAESLAIPAFLFAIVTYLVTSRRATHQAYVELMARFDDVAQRSGETSIAAFKDSTEFHEYIKHRFLVANRVKVTHFSSRTIDASDTTYHELASDLLKRGCAYHRIVCDATSKELWTEQIRWLVDFKNAPFVLHYLPSVAVDPKMKLLDIMLIDDTEVCFGGGYRSGLRFPVISVRNREVAQFFADYYEFLIGRSTSINTYDGPQYLEWLRARPERRWPTNHVSDIPVIDDRPTSADTAEKSL